MTLAENLRTKYGLTSFRVHGNSLPLLAINDALEAAAQIADRSHAPEVSSQIRALKWEDRNAYLRLRNSVRDVA